MGKAVGNPLKFLSFHYQTMWCLDLGNTDFVRENINMGLGDCQIAMKDIFNLPFPHPPFFCC